MLIWLPIKNKDGTVNKYAIEDSTGRYRISRATINDGEKYTVWRGSVAIFYGTSELAKKAAYEDSLRPHETTSKEAYANALSEAKKLLSMR